MPPYLFPAAVNLVVLGLAMLVALRMVYGGRVPTGDPIHALMRAVGFILIAFGWLAILASLGWFLSPVLFFVSLAFVGMAWRQYRLIQRRTNMALLALAVEKQIPLPSCVDSLATELGGRFALWAGKFSNDLKSGMPLPTAIQQSPRVLPKLAGLAAHVGQECNCLDAALRDEMIGHSELEPVRREVASRVLYFLMMLAVMPIVFALYSIKIIPVMIKMFQDFEMELPSITKMLIAVLGQGYASVGALWVSAFGFVVVLWIGLWYGGVPLPELPFLRRFSLRLDRATVQRALAFPAEQQKPLGPMIEVLAEHFPSRSVRRRLTMAGKRIENGQNWIESLRSQSLVGAADAAVFAAAERANNLPWALREMAASNERRAIYRWRMFLQVGSVAMVILFGGIIAFFAVSLFLPLVKLIYSLA